MKTLEPRIYDIWLRDCGFDLQYHRWDFKRRPCPHMTLAIGGTLNTNKKKINENFYDFKFKWTIFNQTFTEIFIQHFEVDFQPPNPELKKNSWKLSPIWKSKDSRILVTKYQYLKIEMLSLWCLIYYKGGNCFVCLFWFFTSHQQSFSYVGTDLPGLNQYWARINVSCSRTQRSDAGDSVRLEPAALRSRVKHSTSEPLRSQGVTVQIIVIIIAK